VAAFSTSGGYYFSTWLLEKGAGAFLCDQSGKTPLMHAAAHGSRFLVGSLLERGDACLNATDDSGYTALDLCRSRPQLPERKRGSRPAAQVIEEDLTYLYNVRRDRGITPIRITEAPSFVQHAGELMRDRKIPELLQFLSKGGLNKEEWKLAAGAAVLADSVNDCMTLLEYCLDQGADVNARDDSGCNVLHGACDVDEIPLRLLRRLVEAGADPTVVDDFGRSVADRVRLTWPEGHKCRTYMEGVLAEVPPQSQ